MERRGVGIGPLDIQHKGQALLLIMAKRSTKSGSGWIRLDGMDDSKLLEEGLNGILGQVGTVGMGVGVGVVASGQRGGRGCGGALLLLKRDSGRGGLESQTLVPFTLLPPPTFSMGGLTMLTPIFAVLGRDIAAVAIALIIFLVVEKKRSKGWKR